MRQGKGHPQSGMTLIEVMVALLILSVGVLGAAAMQLNALKYTDSAMRKTHASFIAQDMLERIRANPNGNYSLGSLSDAPTSESRENPREQDLFDFAVNVKQMLGEGSDGRISILGDRVTIAIDWSDARAAMQDGQVETFALSSVVAINAEGAP